MRRWLIHEVLPCIRQFGIYDPALVGASDAVISKAIFRHYKSFRRRAITNGEAALVAFGLVMVSEFRQDHPIPPRDLLPFAATLVQAARDAGERPQRFFTRAGQKNAWSLRVLFAAWERYQPRLPLFPEAAK